MRNLNSEFGMRNSELFMLCKFTENINFRRGGFYIRPLQIPYFRQIFCMGRVSRPAEILYF